MIFFFANKPNLCPTFSFMSVAELLTNCEVLDIKEVDGI